MEERTLEIKELFEVFKKRIWVVLVITILSASLGVAYTYKMGTMYRSGVKVYIGDSENIINSYTEEQMKYYSGFVNTFREIILIDDFLNETLKHHDLDLTAQQIKEGLNLSAAANSPIIEMSYTSPSKKQAKEVLTALTKEFTGQVKKIMPNANIQIVDSVKVVAIEPAKTKVIILSIVVGMIGSIGLVLVLDYLDDRIHNKENLEKLLPVPVLGQLPHFNAKEEM